MSDPISSMSHWRVVRNGNGDSPANPSVAAKGTPAPDAGAPLAPIHPISDVQELRWHTAGIQTDEDSLQIWDAIKKRLNEDKRDNPYLESAVSLHIHLAEGTARTRDRLFFQAKTEMQSWAEAKRALMKQVEEELASCQSERQRLTGELQAADKELAEAAGEAGILLPIGDWTQSITLEHLQRGMERRSAGLIETAGAQGRPPVTELPRITGSEKRASAVAVLCVGLFLILTLGSITGLIDIAELTDPESEMPLEIVLFSLLVIAPAVLALKYLHGRAAWQVGADAANATPLDEVELSEKTARDEHPPATSAKPERKPASIHRPAARHVAALGGIWLMMATADAVGLRSVFEDKMGGADEPLHWIVYFLVGGMISGILTFSRYKDGFHHALAARRFARIAWEQGEGQRAREGMADTRKAIVCFYRRAALLASLAEIEERRKYLLQEYESLLRSLPTLSDITRQNLEAADREARGHLLALLDLLRDLSGMSSLLLLRKSATGNEPRSPRSLTSWLGHLWPKKFGQIHKRRDT